MRWIGPAKGRRDASTRAIDNPYSEPWRADGEILWLYSKKSRGFRKKAGTDDQVPALIDSDISRKDFRKNWARLIQKIYNVDPLLCPKCQGAMKIISFIEHQEVIEKILRHLGLWETRNHDPPVRNTP